MRNRQVIIAIVQDEPGRFLMVYNARWGGYAFPTIAIPEGGDILGSRAIRAVEEDLGCKLPNASALELDYITYFGTSGSTGEETLYDYWLYDVKPNQLLDLTAAPTWNGNPPMYMAYEELLKSANLNSNITTIAREFVEYQEAVLSIVTRAGESESEFLVVQNSNYPGYFFPVQRVKTEVTPDRFAVRTVRADLGYRGPIHTELRGETSDVHYSPRFGVHRKYRFHICEIMVPKIDLHRPYNELERGLMLRKKQFKWLPGSMLDDSKIGFSETMKAVRPEVLRAIPNKTFHSELRESEGGIALITRQVNGTRQWLAQWNDGWGSFFFVGGKREVGETFRQCVSREIEEELGLREAQCPVASHPAHQLKYRAISGGAGVLTNYTMELFYAKPMPAALEHIASNPMNRWLTDEEIQRLEAYDARPISVTMRTLLELAGLLTIDR